MKSINTIGIIVTTSILYSHKKILIATTLVDQNDHYRYRLYTWRVSIKIFHTFEINDK